METVNDTIPPTDDPPPYRRPERLTRSTSDKVVGGLAGGLGNYFGIDPVVFRIAFVVLTLAGGSGVLLYLLGWLVIPDDRGAGVLKRVGRERDQKLVAAVLIGAAILILADQLTNRGDGDIPVGLVLVGIGALVLWSRRDHDDHDDHDDHRPGPPPIVSPTQPNEPTDPTASVEPPVEPTASFSAPTTTMPAATAPRVKPRSVLVPVTLSLLAILAGGLTLIGVSATTGVALALLLTGGALVVGAWRGRARWLIPIGLVLAVALAAVSIVDVPVRGGTGDVTFRPLTVAEVQTPYRLAAGHLVVDLTALDLGDTTLTVVASVAVGDLEVLVPARASVDLDAHVGAGNLQLFDRPSDGLDVARHVSENGIEGGGRIVLRARTGMGAVEVRRAAA
jgi:phage shock protein PspC (stress-responsive transcriptional regulator)